MSFGRLAGVFGTVLLALSTTAAAEVTQLKFDLLEGYLVLVRANVGPLEDLRLLVDTGAVPSMLDRRIAKKLGPDIHETENVSFGQKARISTAVLPELRLGPLAAHGCRVGIGDLSFLHGVDGIIGLDILSQGSFTIDYKTRL